MEEACGVVDRQQLVADTVGDDGSGRLNGLWVFGGRNCAIYGLPVCRCGHLMTLEPLKNDHGNRTRTRLCFACVLKLESRHVLFSKIHENVEMNRC